VIDLPSVFFFKISGH